MSCKVNADLWAKEEKIQVNSLILLKKLRMPKKYFSKNFFNPSSHVLRNVTRFHKGLLMPYSYSGLKWLALEGLGFQGYD